MPTVFIPSLLRPLADDKDEVSVEGGTIREVINNLVNRYPKLAGRLLEDGRLRGNLSVAIDGEVSTLGMMDAVDEDSEIHFLAAISGG